jgi:hypothetical protein
MPGSWAGIEWRATPDQSGTPELKEKKRPYFPQILAIMASCPYNAKNQRVPLTG